MEDRLSSMTQKMLELQIKYLDLQKKSSDEIISLHDKLHQVLQINNERSQKGAMQFSLISVLQNCLEFQFTFRQCIEKKSFKIPFNRRSDRSLTSLQQL